MKHNQKYLDDLIHDAAYEAVRQSSLFEKCANEVMDAKADELALKVKSVIESWIEKETGESFPVLSTQFRSLSEAQSERDAEMEDAA